jgi:hypothetical protein
MSHSDVLEKITTADLVNRVRVHIGNDHPKSSYMLGFIMGLMRDDPKITVQKAIKQFLSEHTEG